MNEHQVCERCQEETKRPTGFWDGKDEAGMDTGGPMFTCDNPRCKIAAERRRAKAEAEKRRETADEINGAYDIDLEKFRDARRRAGITIYEASQIAGISSATLSAYESRRLPFPILIYNRLMARFNQAPQEGAP